MTVHVTDSTMTSDVTPEFATRGRSAHHKPWRLSWWPDRPLTFEQALAGMELDELVSDPALVHDPMANALMQERAHRMGVVFAQALIRLAARMAARVAAAGELDAPPGRGAARASEVARGGDVGVPRRHDSDREDTAADAGYGFGYATGRPRHRTEPPAFSP